MFLRASTIRTGLGLSAALLLLAVPAAFADYYLVSKIDLTPYFGPLGNNPFTLTSDGTYAYVGGYRGAADVGTIGILKVNLANPADATALSPGGDQLVGQFRYYHGLVAKDGILYALCDRPGGTFATSNVRAINVTTGQLVTTFWGDFEDGDGIVYEPAIITTIPTVGGLAPDPGFGPTNDGAGLSIMGYGSGRRGLIDYAEGKTIYALGSGMIVTDTSGACTVADSSAFRDHVYGPQGNVFTRRSNQVQKSVRNAANGINAYVHLTDALNADGTARVDCGDGKPVQLRVAPFVVGQHLAYLPSSAPGAEGTDLLIFNDRFDGSTRSFANVVKLVDTNGVPAASVQLLQLDGSPVDSTAIADGIGLYDFTYEPDGDRILVLDFTNRDLLVFSSSIGCGTPVQDADDDGDVDLADYALLADCLAGPGAAPAGSNLVACACLDADEDDDVDLLDFAAFQAALGGL